MKQEEKYVKQEEIDCDESEDEYFEGDTTEHYLWYTPHIINRADRMRAMHMHLHACKH